MSTPKARRHQPRISAGSNGDTPPAPTPRRLASSWTDLLCGRRVFPVSRPGSSARTARTARPAAPATAPRASGRRAAVHQSPPRPPRLCHPAARHARPLHRAFPRVLQVVILLVGEVAGPGRPGLRELLVRPSPHQKTSRATGHPVVIRLTARMTRAAAMSSAPVRVTAVPSDRWPSRPTARWMKKPPDWARMPPTRAIDRAERVMLVPRLAARRLAAEAITTLRSGPCGGIRHA